MKDIQLDQISLEKHRLLTVTNIMNLFKTNDRVACVRYTGYGKSYYVLRGLMQRESDKKFLILVPTVSLVSQYTKTFRDFMVEITTYQSLLRRTSDELLALYGDVDYIVCDECHHLGDNIWGVGVNKLIAVLDGVKILGLTATPIRGDSVDVVKTFFNGVQVDSMDLLEGIQHQFLPKIKYVVAYCGLTDVNDRKMLEIDRYGLEKLLNVSGVLKRHLNKEKLNKNTKIIVYVSRLKHIKSTMQQCKKWFKEAFPEKTINIFYQHSLEGQRSNELQLEKFSKKRGPENIDIIVSVDKLSEGVHIPEVSTVIMFRRTKSPVVYFQQIGRTINTDEPLIFDLVDNGERLRVYHKFYEIRGNKINWTGESKDRKVMFEDCIDLIDETKRIEEILDQYRKFSKLNELYMRNIGIIEENLDDIIKYAGEGLSIIKISEKLNLDYYSLRRYFNENNIKSKYGRHTKKAKTQINRIIERNLRSLEVGKLNRKQLAEKAGCNIDYLYSYLCEKHPNLVKTQDKTKGLSEDEKEYIRNNLNAETYMTIFQQYKEKDTTFYIKKYAQRIGLKPSEIQKAHTATLKAQILDYYNNSADMKQFNNDTDAIKHYLQAKFNVSRNMVDMALKEA